ncbi:MAG: C39 family peptidase, partial [Oscillospiraceae bacterium]|nr:C39 family peptidase [Oscillospiraceae bacterium]
HYGFTADKVLLADLMPKFNFYYIDQVLYGADFINTYAGNPASAVSGYGCYTPCMVTTAENYFKQIGEVNYRLTDLTGTDFDSLLSYIDAGRPVMVWATLDMIEPEYTKSWNTPDGRNVQWYENEHCFVLTGYDKAANRVFVNDPQKGKVTYSLSVFRFRYNQMGKYAAVLSGGDIKDVTPAPSVKQPSEPSDCKYKIGDEVKYSGSVYYSANGGKSVEVDGTYEITEILEDDTKPYRIRLGTAGWVPIDFK